MARQTIRPYEISVWTLQDSFIKKISSEFKGQIENGKIELGIDGTQKLTFSLPQKYIQDNEYIDNPIWKDIYNGVLLANLRKVKVIFSHEHVYEFIINKITEVHDGQILRADIECNGLAFEELGKNGYKITLSQEIFEQEYNDWFDKYQAGEATQAEEPIANINYWADKVFGGTNWSYRVDMDWSSYDGIFDNTQRELDETARQASKIYEDEFVSSWTVGDNNSINPAQYQALREKARIVTGSKSNRYNLSQTIAEQFNVFCRYEYEYDENYHIIGRVAIFYNSFLNEQEKLTFHYPYHSSSIQRIIDGTDCITKLYVTPIKDDTQPSGVIDITEEPANFSLEDYILNFDYLYSIGSITSEQYNNVKQYEIAMALANRRLAPYQTELASIEMELPELKAQQITYANAQKSDEERMNEAQAKIAALIGSTGTLYKTTSTPASGIFISSGDGFYYINISDIGVDDTTLHIYSTYSGGYAQDEVSQAGTQKEYNQDGSLSRVVHFPASRIDVLDHKTCYLTYSYSPYLVYQKVYDTYTSKLRQDQAQEQAAKEKIEALEVRKESITATINSILDSKQKAIQDFENMMGPALREGFWQAEDYTDYGDLYKESGSFIPVSQNTWTTFIWDTEPFDGEQLPYYESGVERNKIYFDAYDISDSYDSLLEHIDDLHLYYFNSNGAPQTLVIDATLKFCFIRKDNVPVPALILADTTLDSTSFDKSKDYFIGFTRDSEGTIIDKTTLQANHIILSDTSISKIIYPRIQFKTEKLKTSEYELAVYQGETKLERYAEYSVLSRNMIPYITIKDKALVIHGYESTYAIQFAISNASLALYLDAQKVAAENAYPKVSYEIEINNIKSGLIERLYTYLGHIISINDADLAFDNVQGYISKINLNLDRPWEDDIEVQNYKNKFEDLFSRIVASSEQMKANVASYNRAANAINSTGTLSQNIIQKTLDQTNLNYQFLNGKLTIDDLNGIWGTSDNGVVAYTGGGIFAANQKDDYGNWIWNSAITPNGLNASLITTGQLNTNLIKIYAGNDVAFQINGDGIFAYKKDANDTISSDTYVTYNGDGLFLTMPSSTSGALPVDRVSITWDGLTLRNKAGEPVFQADDTYGNLSITGTITAEDGNIGGWNIQEKYLSSENGRIGMASEYVAGHGTQNIYDVFWSKYTEDSETTYTIISSDGTLSSNNAILEYANITDASIANGTIGGVDIRELVGDKKGITLRDLSGTIFKVLPENPAAAQNDLRFSIELSGLISNNITGWRFDRSNGSITDGELTWEQINYTTSTTMIDFDPDEGLTFIAKYAIMQYSGTINESTLLKLTATDSDNVVYSAIVTLGKIIEGSTTAGEDGKTVTIYATASEFINNDVGAYTPSSIIVKAVVQGFTSEEINAGYWTINDEDGTAVSTGTLEYTVNESSINSGEVKTYFYHITSGLDAQAKSFIVAQSIKKSSSPIQVEIFSSLGNQIVNGQGIGLLCARLYKDGQEIDTMPVDMSEEWYGEELPEAEEDKYFYLLQPAAVKKIQLKHCEEIEGELTWVTIDNYPYDYTYTWIKNNDATALTGKVIYIDANVIDNKATFYLEVEG